MSETAFAIYGLIAEPKAMGIAEAKGQPYGQIDEAKKELAALLEEQLQPQVAIVDWARKDDVQREMRRLIKRQLRAAAYPADKVDSVAESVVDLMKRRRRG